MIKRKILFLEEAKAGKDLSDLVDYIMQDGSNKNRKELAIAFEEAFVNIADHAYEEKGPVSVVITETNNKIDIVLDNVGVYYNPLKARIETFNEDRVGGQGLLLMKTYSDLKYKRIFGHNLLKLSKKI